MNKHDPNNNNPLHLHADPELEAIESMLDELAQSERTAMPAQVNERLLGSVSAVFAPEPIAIDQARAGNDATSAPGTRVWKLRYAAAALLATATTLSIVATKPWPNTQPSPTPTPQNTWSLASFEQDFDAYLELEGVGDDQLDEAVADWELWAQTIDTDVDASYLDQELFADPTDGAI